MTGEPWVPDPEARVRPDREEDDAPRHPDGVRVYRDREGGYRWARYRNGRLVAESGESYRHRTDCLEQAWREAEAFQTPVRDETLYHDA